MAPNAAPPPPAPTPPLVPPPAPAWPAPRLSWSGAPAPDGRRGDPPERRWYGGEVLATDAASLTLGAGGAAVPALWVPAIAGYMVGAPLVHLFEGHPGKCLGSFGLRLSPLAILAVGLAAASSPEDEQFLSDGQAAALVAAAVSIPIVMVVDAAAIAWEDTEPSPGIRARPSIIVTDSAVAATLSGTF